MWAQLRVTEHVPHVLVHPASPSAALQPGQALLAAPGFLSDGPFQSASLALQADGFQALWLWEAEAVLHSWKVPGLFPLGPYPRPSQPQVST